MTSGIGVGIEIKISGITSCPTLEVEHQPVGDTGRGMESNSELSFNPGIKIVEILERRPVSVIDSISYSVSLSCHSESLSESLLVISL